MSQSEQIMSQKGGQIMKKPLGYVHEWTMTEEQRLEYIKNHPIKPIEKPKGESFANMFMDYKWRGKKAADSRWNEKK